ncbi:hypothetical protein BUC_6183 [Burkholderia pseudomallei 576]|nr:hypothetical protein BUC_6183 [Burkholderia pseudomallei 576]
MASPQAAAIRFRFIVLLLIIKDVVNMGSVRG